MKKIFTVFFIILISLSLKANPIAEYYISELVFTDNGWQLEFINLNSLEEPTDWRLVSTSDTIQFNDSIYTATDFVVFDEGDFNGSFNINASGDTIKLIDINNGSVAIQELSFGVKGNIVAPSNGQSICTTYDDYGGNFKYYLDNSPTIGSDNDTANATGSVEGYVTDINGNPLPDVKVKYYIYAPLMYYNILTDENGYYKYTGIARKRTLQFDSEKYQTATRSLQIYPEETITLDTIKLKKREELDYFPLDIGNKWTYEYTIDRAEEETGETEPSYSTTYTCDVVIKIVDDSVAYLVNYYKLLCQRYEQNSPTSKEYFYERYDSTQSWCVFLKNSLEYSEPEYTCISLSAELDDSTDCYFWDYVYPKVKTSLNYFADSTIYMFGNETTAKNFISNNTTENYFVQIANGFGITRQVRTYEDSSAISKLKLKGCIINNIVYGDTALIVGINEKNSESNLPQSFSLSQNYPNPFNPETIIKFTVPNASAKVKIVIYNSLGQEVKTLVNETKAPGNYEVHFDGAKMASGVYFYRLITDSFVQTKKMVLLK